SPARPRAISSAMRRVLPNIDSYRMTVRMATPLIAIRGQHPADTTAGTGPKVLSPDGDGVDPHDRSGVAAEVPPGRAPVQGRKALLTLVQAAATSGRCRW